MTSAREDLGHVVSAELERIEILDVSLRDWNTLKADMPGEVLVTLTGDDADEFVRQVVSLPEGESLRCHIPTCGLRLYQSNGVMTDVSLCFSCNNAWTKSDGMGGDFSFDAASGEAQKFLSELKRHVGHLDGSLRRYWFEFDVSEHESQTEGVRVDGGDAVYRLLDRGVGVTGLNKNDCFKIIAEHLPEAHFPFPKTSVTNIDLSTLPIDPKEIGNPVWRGIWFPPINRSGPYEGS